MGQPEGGQHRQEETTDMLRMQDKLPVRRSNEEPCKEGPQRTQGRQMERVEKREIRHGHGHEMPNLREGLYEPKDDEATYEDGTRSHPRVTDMQRVRQAISNEGEAAGTPEDKLRRGKELGNEGKLCDGDTEEVFV